MRKLAITIFVHYINIKIKYFYADCKFNLFIDLHKDVNKRAKKPKKSEESVDDWSFHQDSQRCDFYDCRTPKGDTVSWVNNIFTNSHLFT